MPALGVCLAVAALAYTSVSASGPTRAGEADAATIDRNHRIESPIKILLHVKNQAEARALLAVRLEAVGVHDTDGMGAALAGLGLRTPDDLDLLDDWAVADLDTELKAGGTSLGDRTKLRIRGIRGGLSAEHVVAQAQLRRAQAKEGTAKAEAKSGGGLSGDTLALVSTAVLGIATFVLQARAAKNAEAAQQDLEHARAEHERARGLAVVQLERVRSQMGDVYRPVQVMFNQADSCVIYMQRELGFEFNDTWGVEFVRPFALWSHVEVTPATTA